ncbi:hypothetical protein [Leptodesmis sp.]|uniref:hypothetical protein n=1 Tax=Leptodesmis sp. TaxID=3100501 RepID=UPI0040534BEC
MHKLKDGQHIGNVILFYAANSAFCSGHYPLSLLRPNRAILPPRLTPSALAGGAIGNPTDACLLPSK